MNEGDSPLSDSLPLGPLQRGELQGSALLVGDAKGSVQLNLDWLRDNCPCALCRIRQTDERRHQPWSEPNGAVALAVRVDGGALVVDWAGGHVSTYDPTTWQSIERSMRRGLYDPQFWRAGHQLARFAHDAVVADTGARLTMLETFRREGAVVVVGAPTVPGSVVEFAKAVGLTLLDSSLGFLFDVKLDPAGYNVAFTNEALLPHNDNAQYANRPTGQILAMLVNDATGGDSIVVDGWSVLDELERVDPAAVEVLSRVEIGFRQYSDDADGFTRVPLVRRDSAGRFTQLRFSNQLMQPLPFDHPDLAEWYRAYRALGALITDPAMQITFRLTGGDMLIVSGERVMHARTGFVADGPRHLQDVYFNVEDAYSAISVLTGEARNAMVHV